MPSSGASAAGGAAAAGVALAAGAVLVAGACAAGLEQPASKMITPVRAATVVIGARSVNIALLVVRPRADTRKRKHGEMIRRFRPSAPGILIGCAQGRP